MHFFLHSSNVNTWKFKEPQKVNWISFLIGYAWHNVAILNVIMWLQHSSRHVNAICHRSSSHRLHSSIRTKINLKQTSAHWKCHGSLSSVSNHNLKTCVLTETPENSILFIHLQVTPGTSLLLQHKTVKQEVLWGCRCRHDPAERAARPGNAACDPPPEALTDLRRHKSCFVWKQTTECATWSACHCWEERARTSRRRGWWCSLCLDLSPTMGVVNSPYPLAAGERASIKEGHIVGHWCNTYSAFHIPHCRGFAKQIEDMGTGPYNLGYEICLKHDVTSRNLS